MRYHPISCTFDRQELSSLAGSLVTPGTGAVVCSLTPPGKKVLAEWIAAGARTRDPLCKFVVGAILFSPSLNHKKAPPID